MLNGHGDDIYSQGCEIKSNFSSNIYYKHDLRALQDHLCNCIGGIHSYPEPDAGSLSRLLAEKSGIEPFNICITNGATEAIYLIAQAFARRKSTIVIPTFSEYEDACTIHQHTLRFCEHPAEIDAATQMVWLCNPNNPTGRVYEKELLEELVQKHPDTVFVFDQSYEDFITQPAWTISEACRYRNVILLHSMTKSGCIPGLRLGYFTAHADTMEQVGKYRMPWSVNRLALEAGLFLTKKPLEDIPLEDYLAETRRLQKALSEIESITVLPSETHFFLCRLKNASAYDLKQYLVKKHGILIRDASNFRGLDERYFRIATQSTEENEKLLQAIQTWSSLNSIL